MKLILKIIGIFFLITMVFTVISLIYVGSQKDEEKGKLYYDLAIKKLENKQIDSVNYYINESIQYYSFDVPDKVNELEKDLKKLNDTAFIKSRLVEMSDKDYKLLTSNKYLSDFSNYESLNKIFSEKLSDFAPQRTDLMEEKRLANERKKKVERKEMIESQFTGGRHVGLEVYLMRILNDPDSFEHVETRYKDEGNYLLVFLKYRANNKFGAKVLNTATAKVDFNGNVIEMINLN